MDETTTDESVVIEFINEDTGELLETAELPKETWEDFERLATLQDTTPEDALKTALLDHLDRKSAD